MGLENLPMDTYFEKALELVKEAGTIVRDQVKKAKSVETKSCDKDLVTETDKQVENHVFSGLRKSFENHSYIGEESTSNGKVGELTDNPTWIIDPVDGTMNFVHGYPNFCISLALWINKKPCLGIVYNPVLDQMFTAQRGKGTYLNGDRIYCSKEKELGKSLVTMEFGTSREEGRVKTVYKNVQNLLPVLHGLRSSGSAALNMAMVAMGAAEGYYEFGIHIWDIAAGIILIEEAGGVVVDPLGGELDPLSRRILGCCSQEIAQQMIPHLEQYYPERD